MARAPCITQPGVARTQSRRAVSLSLEAFDLLSRLRERHRIPGSQIVAQLLWALLRGTIQIAPARSPYLIGLETYALRAAIAEADERGVWEAKAAKGTCATCSERDLVVPTELEDGGPEYPICWSCSRPAEQPPHGSRARRAIVTGAGRTRV